MAQDQIEREEALLHSAGSESRNLQNSGWTHAHTHTHTQQARRRSRRRVSKTIGNEKGGRQELPKCPGFDAAPRKTRPSWLGSWWAPSTRTRTRRPSISSPSQPQPRPFFFFFFLRTNCSTGFSQHGPRTTISHQSVPADRSGRTGRKGKKLKIKIKIKKKLSRCIQSLPRALLPADQTPSSTINH